MVLTCFCNSLVVKGECAILKFICVLVIFIEMTRRTQGKSAHHTPCQLKICTLTPAQYQKSPWVQCIHLWYVYRNLTSTTVSKPVKSAIKGALYKMIDMFLLTVSEHFIKQNPPDVADLLEHRTLTRPTSYQLIHWPGYATNTTISFLSLPECKELECET